MQVITSLKNNYPIIIVSLFPLALVAGPFIAEILLLFMMFFFIKCFLSKEKIINNKNIILFLLLFTLYLILSSAISEFKLHSLRSSFFYFRFIFYSLGVYLILKKTNQKNIKLFNYIILLTLLILSIDGIIQYFLGKNIFIMSNSSIKISGMFGDEQILGSFLVRFLPLAIFICFDKKIGYVKMFLIICLISFTVIISAERTSLVLLILVLSLTFIFFIKYNKKLKWTVPAIITMLIVSFFIYSTHDLSNRYFSLTVKQFINNPENIILDNKVIRQNNDKNKAIEKTIFNNHYYSHYYSSYKMFLDKKLFGHGPNNYRKICDDENYFFKVFLKRENNKYEEITQGSCSTHPHNIIAQFISELGIIGLIFLVIAEFYLFKQLFITFMNKDKIFFLILMMVISLWPISTSGNFFNNWLSMVYFYPLGIYFYYKNII